MDEVGYMEEHVYEKDDLIRRFEEILNKTFGEIDNVGILEHIRNNEFKLQKGVAGTIVEQCVLGYSPDSKQQADLIVVDGGDRKNTELKVTGMRISTSGDCHYVAKEPVSITGVGVFDLANQTFYESHFWNKLEHMLIVYYYYLSTKPVAPYDYKEFPIKGYEFHEFSQEDEETLKNDWTYVHDLVASIVQNHPGSHDDAWKAAVKQEYLDKHSSLRRLLSYIDLAPKFPPRFRLKKPIVNTIIARHFGYSLEQLPGRYTAISAIDSKCQELQQEYRGKTIGEIADILGVPKRTEDKKENKGIVEQIMVKMFGGNAKKLNNIELFQRFGLIAKSIAVTPAGRRTEDMKLYHIDFAEMMQDTFTEEDGSTRPFVFEDSEMYGYFADHEFLCIIYEEPAKENVADTTSESSIKIKHPLAMNKFIGFQRLVFSDEFIDNVVKKVWEDTRNKIKTHQLADVVSRKKDGTAIQNKNGEVCSAPNFIKSSQNDVFIRGGGTDSSLRHKTECVNGIKMLPQFVWIKGSAICTRLRLHSGDDE